MKESKLEAKIVKHCRDHGILCYKFSSPARRGVPDRLLIKGGKVMFLEIKAEGKVPTALQRRELAILQAENMRAMWTNNYQHAVERIDDWFAEELV